MSYGFLRRDNEVFRSGREREKKKQQNDLELMMNCKRQENGFSWWFRTSKASKLCGNCSMASNVSCASFTDLIEYMHCVHVKWMMCKCVCFYLRISLVRCICGQWMVIFSMMIEEVVVMVVVRLCAKSQMELTGIFMCDWCPLCISWKEGDW